MSVLDKLAAIIAPHICVGCGREDGLLCSSCMLDLKSAPVICGLCQRKSPHGDTCETCRENFLLDRADAVTVYEDMAKQLIWRLKSGGAQSAAGRMAELMAMHLNKSVKSSAPNFIVPVPTASGRARQRGYDQAQLLARSLSRRARATYLPCLARVGQTHQVGSSRAQRMEQLAGSFRVGYRSRIVGAHVLLVDDVMTTGASLNAAAQALKAAGAARVEAIVFARAPLTKS